MNQQTDYASPEQRVYARWLDIGTRVGFVTLVITFLVYASGLLPSHVPVADLPRYWTLSVEAYRAATGAPVNWGWVAQLHEGDYLNFVGIAILAAVTAVCYARVLPLFLRTGERVFAAICVLEIVVLGVAAAGLVGGAH
jgi:hypothetical protein